MKQRILQVAKYLLFLGIGIFLLFLAFRGIDFQHLWDSLRQAHYGWIGVSLFFSLLGFISRAVRWKILIDPLGKPVNVFHAYHALMIGYLANFAFPRLGEVTRCASLNRTDKVPVDKLLGTVIAERVFDLIMLALLILFLLLFRWEFFGNFLETKIFEPIFGKVNATFALPLTVWIALGGFFILLLLAFLLFKERILSISIFRKMAGFGKGIGQGFISVVHMKKRGWFIFHTLFIWACYVVMTYVVCLSISSTASLEWIDGVFLLVIGALGMSAPVQGGFGAFHWIVSLGLTLYGLSREEGLVYATLAHESQAIFVVVLGAVSFYALSFSKKRKAKV